MENLIFSLNATVPIFFTMILGFVFRKVGLMDEEFTESLRNASSVDEFMDIIDRADSEKKDIDERLADTGSAEGIEKAAKAKNC